jgi:hypothetical protein
MIIPVAPSFSLTNLLDNSPPACDSSSSSSLPTYEDVFKNHPSCSSILHPMMDVAASV